MSSRILWQRNLCHGFDLITTSQRIRRKLLSLATAPVGSPQLMSLCVTLKSLAMCSADPAPFGGRLNTTVGYAVRAVLSLAGAVVTVLETLRLKATLWLSYFS